ncbi:CHRD domain-containing protein [Botrimarina mediterranea]|uniref:CHRD domain protein n=1 Tax=Botrimarina mediterranea TaxID=2528022 RepID=A0A518K6X9_9BACT|nr:CHRD domain-containing protein [Botrimarina mediterranea]QDV73551.1 CHRD domain protein [Botrimarina mediterranea]QDV78142.1 CHRD domain protein [Planctomycetes bacterium K2D]
MRHRLVLASVLVCGMTALSGSLAAAQSFPAFLSGDQEVGPVATPATGIGTLDLTGGPGAWVATYSLSYSDLLSPIVNPPGAHIHNAAAGMNGPVVHGLDNIAAAVGTTSGVFTGDWRYDDASNPLTDMLVGELFAGRLYFNIHTAQNTSGEIRGQIVPEPTSIVAALSLIATAATYRRR